MDRIAVVGGDGIGPEVIGCTVDVLAEAQRSASGFELDSLAAPAGAGTYFETGDALPAKAPATCRAADSILLGACGLPGVRYPDGTEIFPQDTLWIVLDRYAGIRPARQLASAPSPLVRRPPIDFVLVCENTEGIFAALGGGIVLGDRFATDTQVITRRGIERVARSTFRLARRRGRDRSRVTYVDKDNLLHSSAFFCKIFDEVAAEFPDVAADHLDVDAAALELVRRPGWLDLLARRIEAVVAAALDAGWPRPPTSAAPPRPRPPPGSSSGASGVEGKGQM